MTGVARRRTRGLGHAQLAHIRPSSGYVPPIWRVSARQVRSPIVSTYVARQPIFDSDVQTHGYELIYPNHRPIDDDEMLLAGRTRFLSIDWDSVLSGAPKHLSAANTVLQLSPRGEDRTTFGHAVSDLKNLGFHVSIALDRPDRIDRDLSSRVDYISVNIAEVDQEIIEEVAHRFGGGSAALIARHVSLPESLEALKSIGYEYFQGAFFSHPISTNRDDIPASATARLMLLREINQVELDIDRVARAISADVSLTYKLLSLVNSAAMGLRREVTSVKHAALMLGEIAIRKWATVLIVRDFGEQQPNELLIHSLIR